MRYRNSLPAFIPMNITLPAPSWHTDFLQFSHHSGKIGCVKIIYMLGIFSRQHVLWKIFIVASLHPILQTSNKSWYCINTELPFSPVCSWYLWEEGCLLFPDFLTPNLISEHRDTRFCITDLNQRVWIDPPISSLWLAFTAHLCFLFTSPCLRLLWISWISVGH